MPRDRSAAALLGGPALRRLGRFLVPAEQGWERLLALAVAIGLLSGLSAVGLRQLVHALFDLLQPHRSGASALLLPALGAGVGAAIVAWLFQESRGHGVPEVIRAVCRGGGRMRRRAIASRWLGSAVSVGSGGSAGLEGPIVYSAAAIGSAVGGFFRVDERRRSILLACGVAGGISGVFNAPMTGMIFASEVVLAEWGALSIVPVAVSAVCGTVISRWFLGNEHSFLHAPFDMGAVDLVACALLGVAAGLISTGLVRTIGAFERLAKRLPRSGLTGPLAMGLGVGLVGLAAPQALGEGYGTAQAAIRGALAPGIAAAAGLLVAKIFATGLTLGSGAPGGVFAPCLVVGSLLGSTFARSLVALAPAGFPLAAEGSYALVAMSGLVAGVLKAPLTGIFLVMEVTEGYEVILPLMIVSVFSLVIARRFDLHSIYTRELAAAGELLRPGTDQRILADVSVGEALDADVTRVDESLSLTDFLLLLRGSRRNHFPVLRGGSDIYVGMLELGAVRPLLLDPELARVTLVGTVMDTEAPTLSLHSSLSDALQHFERTGAWVLPVLDGERFAGLLSKSTLFDRYRKELSVQAPL